ncbi:MAG: molybdopterin-dependent oxidoreductase [Actinobacteria bacterium]|nr:molybdopterin-dependent oxidoreductase [Actinomycetota bacterium]
MADIGVGGCLDAVFVRSYDAHGSLVSVDASEAGSVPGVAGAWAAADLPELPDVPFPPGSRSPAEMGRPALARGRVRYVGEPVAVVLAADRYAAEDGAGLVMVEIDPLPPLLDPGEAAASGTSLFDDCDNVAAVREYGAPVGDVMDRAPVVIEDTIRNQRVVPSSIEARAILVVPEAGGLTIWASHQAPHRLQRSLAKTLGLDPSSVRVVVPRVGGAFGAKSQTYPEYVVVAYLSMMLGRPVRWIEDRREAFAGATHGRGQTQHLRLAADEEGRILALEALIDADVGAYPHTGELVPSMTAWVMSGAYEIPNLFVRTRAVVTNQTPTASYRGAGRPEAAFAVERMVDKLAHRLSIDPAEIRRRNFIPPDHFPYGSPTGALYDSARHSEALDQALELIDYEGLRSEQARRRAAGEGPLLGIGMASYVERSGGQPGTSEYGSVEIDPDGTIVARSGTSPQGQGNTTVLAQIVADAFGADLDRVRIVQSDTSEVPSGTGTFASRSVQVGGSALHQASVEVIEEALRRGAKRFGAAASDVAYSDGRITSISGGSVELVDLLADGPLVSEIEFSAPQAFPFGTYVVALEVDLDTGGIGLLRIAVVDDCGVVVNPAGVRGQTIGSLAQGIGQALFEAIPYDEGGQPLVSTMMDYSLPTAAEIPELRLGEIVTPNPNVPLGTKGAGEAGCIGAPPAIVNAVVDALAGYDAGIEMPVTPEKVWRALARRDDREV